MYKQHFPTSLSFVEKDKEFYLAYKDEFSELCKMEASNFKPCRSGICFNKECVYPPSGSYGSDLLKNNVDFVEKSFTNYLPRARMPRYPKTRQSVFGKSG